MKGLGIRIGNLIESGRVFGVSVLVCGMIAVGALGCADPEPGPYSVCEGGEDMRIDILRMTPARGGNLVLSEWPDNPCYEKLRESWVCETGQYGTRTVGIECAVQRQADYDVNINTGADGIARAEAACTPGGDDGGYAFMTEAIAGHAPAPSREQWCRSRLSSVRHELEVGTASISDETGWCDNYDTVLNKIKKWEREFDSGRWGGRKVSDPGYETTLPRLTLHPCVDSMAVLGLR